MTDEPKQLPPPQDGNDARTWDFYDLRKNVSLDYCVLADAADVHNGKQYIHAAGWDSAACWTFPASMRWAMALRIRVPWDATNFEHTLLVDVVDEQHQSILAEKQHLDVKFNVGRPPGIPHGIDQVIPMAFDMSRVAFPEVGQYAVVLTLNGRWMARSPFNIYQAPNENIQ